MIAKLAAISDNVRRGREFSTAFLRNVELMISSVLDYVDIKKLGSALVIDSVGCIVDRGAEIYSSLSGIELKIYDVVVEEENVLNSEKLKKLLVKYFSERARERAEGFLDKIILARVTMKDVYEIIRQQTGVYDIDDDFLASYAEKIGLQVPFEKKTRESRIHKLTVKLDMVEKHE